MVQFRHLQIPEHWEKYWSKYPQGYTIMEALIDWVSQVDEMTTNVNDWNTYLDDFVDKFDGNLKKTVADLINEMKKDGSLAEFINENVFKEINDKMARQKVELEKQIKQMSTLDLKGVYASLSALKLAKPSGDTGLFLATDNGNIYWWNGSTWVSTGPIVGFPFEEDSLTSKMRTKNGNYLRIQCSQPLNINTKDKTIEFPTNDNIRFNNRAWNNNISTRYSGTTLDISFGGASGGWLYFNVTTETFKTSYTGSSETITEDDVFIGVMYWSNKTFFINAEFTVDGYTNFMDRTIPYKQTSMLSNRGRLLSTQKVLIDPVAKVVIFPDAPSVINMIIGNETQSMKTLRGTTWDLSEQGANYIVFDHPTKTLISLSSLSKVTDEQCFLGYINWGSNFAVDLDFNYSIINQNSDSIALNDRWKGKTVVCLGTSITNGDDGQGSTSNTHSWTSYLSELNGFETVINKGVNGSTYAKRSTRTDSLEERSATINGIDGLIIVEGLVNDFHNNITRGYFTNAVKLTFETLVKNNPHATILVMTDLRTTKILASDTPNTQTLVQKDYNEIVINEAVALGLDVLDLFNHSGISPLIKEQADIYQFDRLHPTKLGYKRLAYHKISPKISTI